MFRIPVRNRSGSVEKWCGSGAVLGETGAESEGSGTAEAKVWEIGADSERVGGKWCGTGPVWGESGAEAVGWMMEEGRNQRALGRQRKRFGQPVRNRSSWGEEWCRSGAVGDGSGVESEGSGTAEAKV